MNPDEFRKQAHLMVEWMADYMEHVEDYPVKSQVAPKTIYNQIESSIPDHGQEMEAIFKDFKEVVLPGITHPITKSMKMVLKDLPS
mgnify:CR=1 FL=1